MGGTIGLAEGTGSGIGTIGHQIGHQQRKSTAKELDGAPEETRKPRIRGSGRANAADRQSLWREKIRRAALEGIVLDLRFVWGLRGESQGR